MSRVFQLPQHRTLDTTHLHLTTHGLGQVASQEWGSNPHPQMPVDSQSRALTIRPWRTPGASYEGWHLLYPELTGFLHSCRHVGIWRINDLCMVEKAVLLCSICTKLNIHLLLSACEHWHPYLEWGYKEIINYVEFSQTEQQNRAQDDSSACERAIVAYSR